MGIPYYFAFLVKNYPEIMGAYVQEGHNTGSPALYIDANSIVYDVIRDIGDDGCEWATRYDIIIDGVIKRLKELIASVKGCTAFIAFDGVAPKAKMEQQRQRRARMGGSGLVFITPGTDFMCKLTAALVREFENNNGVIVSGSDVVGEGEHKIFAHIREWGVSSCETYVYGLDADLIILALMHLKYRPHLYLLREKNQMTLTHAINTDTTLFMLKIRKFAGILTARENLNIDDYIFMSFFLGNDFMPHFPALNIRTTGIEHLMWAYRKMPKSNEHNSLFVGSGGNVCWENVRTFISMLAQKEADWFWAEHVGRDKMEIGILRSIKDAPAKAGVPEDNHAMLNRETEKYIAPQYPNWEQRYYSALFGDEAAKKGDIVQNWLEGLEWCLKYYMSGVPSWGWLYRYNYPPLFVDIITHMQTHYNIEFTDVGEPCSAAEQLAYIMPKTAAPEPIANYEWSYCRYMWESHHRG